MKLLVIHSELGVLRGGGENFTRNLFSAFAARGHNIKATFLADRRSSYPIPLPANIEPIPIPGWWSRNAGQEMFSRMRSYIPRIHQCQVALDRLQDAVSWRVLRWHEGRFERRVEREFAGRWDEFDAIYVHHSAVLASKIALRRPTILRLPGPASSQLAPVLRAVHAVCANGDALKRIREFLGNHAIELPVGIDERRFNSEGPTIRRKLGWKSDDLVIGYVGRLTHLKGVDLLATAFREISRIVPKAKLLVVGSGAEEKFMRATLAQEIERRKAHIESDVSHESLGEWYRAMNLFVMPSRYENFSNSMLEAMSCGVPFIASDVGGNKMLAEKGSGRLFEAESIASLLACLRANLDDADDLKARGRVGCQYIRSLYSWEVSARRLEEIFASRLGVT